MSVIDIMVDVESLSLDPNAHILSIGAAKFDRNTGEIKKEFYVVINQSAVNGDIDAATISWWMRQDNRARDAIWGVDVETTALLAKALHRLSVFVYAPVDPIIWQRGTMDYVWLEQAYKREGLKPMWKHSQWHDQRTVCNMAGGVKRDRPVRHHALGDCIDQIDDLVLAFKKIGG
jgi:hypothetical protein